jgi:uncharacterized OsmC-like protein
LAEPPGKTVGTDCPYTGKGEEISPMNLLGSALAGCMFLSMGAVALRNKLDLSGAYADVEISTVDKPVSRIGAIDLTFTMPSGLSETDRTKLERAAGLCPIKPSFHPDVAISVRYSYSE